VSGQTWRDLGLCIGAGLVIVVLIAMVWSVNQPSSTADEPETSGEEEEHPPVTQGSHREVNTLDDWAREILNSLPTESVRPVDFAIHVKVPQVALCLVFDQLISAECSERQSRWILQQLISRKDLLFQECQKEGFWGCTKALVFSYTDPKVFEFAKKHDAIYGFDVSAFWTDPIVPKDKVNSSNFLPQDTINLKHRLDDARIFGDLHCPGQTGSFIEIRGIEKATRMDAIEAAAIYLDILSGSCSPLMLVQLFPEMESLGVHVPVRHSRDLNIRIQRDDLFALANHVRKYRKRYFEYLNRESDISLRHFQGELTEREAEHLERAVVEEKRRFIIDIWNECQRFMKPASGRGG